MPDCEFEDLGDFLKTLRRHLNTFLCNTKYEDLEIWMNKKWFQEYRDMLRSHPFPPSTDTCHFKGVDIFADNSIQNFEIRKKDVPELGFGNIG